MALAKLKFNQLFADLTKPSGFGYNVKRLLDAVENPYKYTKRHDFEFFQFEVAPFGDNFTPYKPPKWKYLKDPQCAGPGLWLDSQATFFDALVKSGKHDEDLLTYLKGLITHNTAHPYEALHTCDEISAGIYPFLALLRQKPEHMPLFIEYLRSLDLDHESVIWDTIYCLVKTLGWRAETVQLMAARYTSCCGQHGTDQVQSHAEHEGLNDALADEALYRVFADTLATEVMLCHEPKFYTTLHKGKRTQKALGENVVRALDELKAVVKEAADGEKLFIKAIKSGDLESVKRHVNSVQDINTEIIRHQQDDHFPLAVALDKEQFDIAECLLAHGASFYAADRYGSVFSRCAAIYDDSTAKDIAKKHRCLEWCIDHGAEINFSAGDGDFPIFHTAIAYRHQPTLDLLLEKGADINQPDGNGQSPIFQCIRKNVDNFATQWLPIMKWLLDAGCDVNHQRDDGYTPLHIAAYLGNQEAIETLLAHGADPNIKDKIGFYPTGIAANHGHLACMLYLADQGAKCGTQDKRIYNLHKAISAENEKAIETAVEKINTHGEPAYKEMIPQVFSLAKQASGDHQGILDNWRAERDAMKLDQARPDMVDQLLTAAEELEQWGALEAEILPWLMSSDHDRQYPFKRLVDLYLKADMRDVAIALYDQWRTADNEGYRADGRALDREPVVVDWYLRPQVIHEELTQRLRYELAQSPETVENFGAEIFDYGEAKLDAYSSELLAPMTEAIKAYMPLAYDDKKRFSGLTLQLKDRSSEFKFYEIRRASFGGEFAFNENSLSARPRSLAFTVDGGQLGRDWVEVSSSGNSGAHEDCIQFVVSLVMAKVFQQLESDGLFTDVPRDDDINFCVTTQHGRESIIVHFMHYIR